MQAIKLFKQYHLENLKTKEQNSVEPAEAAYNDPPPLDLHCLHISTTVELRWLEHFRNHENMFETGVVRDNEC